MRRGRSGSRPGGPDAAWAIRSLNCGSLTGDSGAVGRRPRLTFFGRRKCFALSAEGLDSRLGAVRSIDREDSSSRGLTAIILRLRWSSLRGGFWAAASFCRRDCPRTGTVPITIFGTGTLRVPVPPWVSPCRAAAGPPCRLPPSLPGPLCGRRARPRRGRPLGAPHPPVERSCEAASWP
jgi:hypothetical protein